MVQEILNVFEGFRMSPLSIDQYESAGKALLASKIERYVSAGQVIPFVMLGFPFKSTNSRDKVLGLKPDMGEELTLNNFRRFNDQVKTVYPAGVNISIASDGFLFNDLLGATDRTVEEYKEISQDMGKEAPMKWYDLKDFYSSSHTLPEMRDKIMGQFGINEEELQNKILFNPDFNMLYRGMTIFMMQELAIKNYPSNNQLQKAAKLLTREMMMRNEAYSNLVGTEFKDCIRISMHPTVNNGKYSFQLIPSPKAKHSAWHSCVVINSTTGEIETMHKKDAQAAGYTLSFKNNQPYYFTA